MSGRIGWTTSKTDHNQGGNDPKGQVGPQSHFSSINWCCGLCDSMFWSSCLLRWRQWPREHKAEQQLQQLASIIVQQRLALYMSARRYWEHPQTVATKLKIHHVEPHLSCCYILCLSPGDSCLSSLSLPIGFMLEQIYMQHRSKFEFSRLNFAYLAIQGMI